MFKTVCTHFKLQLLCSQLCSTQLCKSHPYFQSAEKVRLLIMSYVTRLLASAVVAVVAVTMVMFVEEVGLIIVLYGISTNNLAL